jgi:hypothetical protein
MSWREVLNGGFHFFPNDADFAICGYRDSAKVKERRENRHLPPGMCDYCKQKLSLPGRGHLRLVQKGEKNETSKR